MGVKDLWSVLSPTCEKKSLWELENKTIAIDLSAWICDSQFTGSLSNTYLRNLFFRTSYLLLLGVRPVFVLEGEAPILKADTIRRRQNKVEDKGGKVVRARLSSSQKQCLDLLACLGINCVKAPGEAEAFCAQMNYQGVACGVVTQDSDAFLYGAVEVYRNFQLAPHYTCDVYKMSTIESRLGLSREKMIALALLTGCDYSGGVTGIGKELAMKYLRTVPEGRDVLKRFQEWRDESSFQPLEKNKYATSNFQLELSVKEKAVQTEGFPDLKVVEEFLKDPGEIVVDYKWGEPNLAKFVSFAVKKLRWDEEYAVSKFFPLVTRWHLVSGGAPMGSWVTSVVKSRTLRGKLCYEVAWDSQTATTTEPRDLVLAVYPELVQQYEDSKKPTKVKKQDNEGKKRARKGGKKEESGEKKKAAEGGGSNSTLDKFITRAPPPPPSQVDEDDEESSDEGNSSFNLSAIIESIVSRPNSNPALEHFKRNKI